MGVTNLWALLEPCGRRVDIQALRGLRLAVDASGWIFKFIKAMRDEQGEMLPNAHLIGFFRRICKLLFYNIRPVFIFDGSTPALKRHTVIERRRRREQQGVRVRHTAEKLLINRLKQHALASVEPPQGGGAAAPGAAGSTAASQLPPEPTSQDGPSTSQGPSEPAAAQPNGAEDEAAALALAVSLAEEGSGDDDMDIDLLLPEGAETVDAAVLSTLPPSMQLEVMLRLRERHVAANRSEFEGRAGKPADFSQFQMQQYLKASSLRRQLDMLKDNMNAAAVGVGGTASRRIAAEEGREYILQAQPSAEEVADGLEASAAAAAAEAEHRQQQEAAQPQALRISFLVDAEVSEDDVGWEDVEDESNDAWDATGQAPGSKDKASLHWRERAAQRQRYWSLSHGFQMGRKLGEWGEAPPAAELAAGGVGAAAAALPEGGMGDETDADMQHAIRLSLLEAGGAARDHSQPMQQQQGKEEEEEEDVWEDAGSDDEPPQHHHQQQQQEGKGEEGGSGAMWPQDGGTSGAAAIAVEELTRQPAAVAAVEDRTHPRLDARFPAEDVSPSSGSALVDSDTAAAAAAATSEQQLNGRDAPLVWDRITHAAQLTSPGEPVPLSPIAVPATAGRDAAQAPPSRQVPSPSLPQQQQQQQEEEEEEEANLAPQALQQPMQRQQEEAVASPPPPAPVATSDKAPVPQPAVPLLSPSAQLHLLAGTSRQAAAAAAAAGAAPARKTVRFAEQPPDDADVEWAVWTDSNRHHAGPAASPSPGFLQLPAGGASPAGAEQEPPGVPPAPAAAAASAGDVEEYAAALRREETELRAQHRAAAGQADAPVDQMYRECQELLQLFGLPYLIAPAEAEAQAAWLDAAGLVEGVVTDDNDAFLFGARRVFRNMFEERRYVEEYRTADLETEMGLDRSRLVALALLLGSDYTAGVGGVGVVNALEIVRAFPGQEGLRRFSAWLQSVDEELVALARSGGKKRKPAKKKAAARVKRQDNVAQKLSLKQQEGSTPGGVDGRGEGEARADAAAAGSSDAAADQGDASTPPTETGPGDSPEDGEQEVQEEVDEEEDAAREFCQRHRTARRTWTVPSGFPSDEVAAAYEAPQVDAAKEKLVYGRPDLELLRVFCSERFGWQQAKTDELLLPVVKAFDQRETQRTLDSFVTAKHRFAKIKSKRLQKAVAGITGGPNEAIILEEEHQAASAPKPRAKRAPKASGTGAAKESRKGTGRSTKRKAAAAEERALGSDEIQELEEQEEVVAMVEAAAPAAVTAAGDGSNDDWLPQQQHANPHAPRRRRRRSQTAPQDGSQSAML